MLRDKFGWPDDDLAHLAASLAEFTVGVRPTRQVDAVPEDPDDNRVLTCALAAGSRYIVTGDAALLRLGRYEGIEILRVAEFMSLIAPES